MKFIDEARLTVASGKGGDGCISFRREKYVPRGGPDGGDGGKGGDVVLYADPNLATLLDLRYRRTYKAKNGQPGGANNMTGATGDDVRLRVPIGTQAYDDDTGALIVDLTEPEQTHVLVRGGNGGRGNAAFATPARRTPDFAKPGGRAEELNIRLELKLLADVGLVGFPNAGKSTLISRISRARPKIADYPFTTLTPNLGVVSVDVDRSYVVADMPGLIEGAADGAGLGHQFLRHIERTALFVYLVTQDLAPGRDPIGDYHALRHELGRYDETLLDRPAIIALSQCDRPDVREQLDDLRAAIDDDTRVIAISAVTGDGLDALHKAIADTLTQSGRWGEVDDW